MLTWIVKECAPLRRAQEEHRKLLRETAETAPSSLMNEREKKDLTAGIYLGQVTLDVNRYREAREKVNKNEEKAETIQQTAKGKHIANVQAAQHRMQQGEVTFVSPATGGIKTGKDIHWLATAVSAAREHLDKLSTALQVPPSDITVFNIVALQTRGMLSKKTLHAVRHHVLMGGLPGPIMILYPVIPSKVYSGKRTSSVASGAAPLVFGEPASGGEGGGADSSEDDDFDEEGQLPEVVTRSATLMSAWERAAALSKDHFAIDSTLGQYDLSKYYQINITISHKIEDGKRQTDKAMVLVPASGGGGPEPFHGAGIYKDGLYTEVENDVTFVNVSKKASMQCKKDMAQNWKTELPFVQCRGRVNNKRARGQVGVEGYRTVFMDLMNNCETSTMVINDLMGGVGEVGVATVRVKVSPEASEKQKRVCYFGSEERRVFAEIAKANIGTEIGQSFVEGKLSIPGLVPLPVPRDTPASGGMSSETILAALGNRPLQQLQIDREGRLLIPTEEELNNNPPVEMTDDILDFFANQRLEFPRPAVATPATGGEQGAGQGTGGGGGGQGTGGGSGEGAGGGGQGTGGGSGEGAGGGGQGTGGGEGEGSGGQAKILPPGSVLNSRGDLLALLQAPQGALLKEHRRADSTNLLLVRTSDREEPYRVLMENVTGRMCKREAGTFMGRGGRGTLYSSTSENAPPQGRQERHCWTFNRGTEWKRDIAIRANGNWVLKSASGDTPKMQTLEDIGKQLGTVKFTQLWAHTLTKGSRTTRVTPVSDTVLWVPAMKEPENGCTFSDEHLSQWIPAREENTATGLECKGTLRPAFEVQLENEQLTPDNNPATSNCCCLFLKKAIQLKDKQLLVL